MRRNIALMGRAGSGKDTVAGILARRFGYRRVAFADPLKDMALAVDPIVAVKPKMDGYRLDRLSDVVAEFGWDEAKRRFPEVRTFLQRLGLEGVREVVGDHTWIDLAVREIYRLMERGHPVVVTDVRFLNEVRAMRLRGFALVWVERPGVGDGAHPSERSVDARDAEFVLENSGSLEELERRVVRLVESV